MNRVLEFSKTVGLCNYQSSPRTFGGSGSRTSDIDSESRVRATSLYTYFDSLGLTGSWTLLGSGIATIVAP